MKFMVLSTLVAVAAGQGFFGLQAGPDGTITPLDEPVVAAAKAEHLATKFGGVAAPYAYAASYGYAEPAFAAAPIAAAPIAAAPIAAAPIAAAPLTAPLAYAPAYNGPLHFPRLVVHPNGAVVPADEPAVAAARAAHLAAKQEAYLAAGPIVAAVPTPLAAAPLAAVPLAAAPLAPAPLAYAPAYAGPLHYPQLVAHPNGAVVPADEPAVVAARAQHLAAHGLSNGIYGGVYGAVYGGVYDPAAQSFYGLVAHPNGAVVPVDEPAVQAARAEHLSAFGRK